MASIKYVKAKPTKSTPAKKSEKAAQFGDVNPPRKAPRKFAPIGAAKQYGQKNLEPVHKTYRGGSR